MIENAREKAGRKGGKAAAKSHDKNFYERLGEKGSEKTAKTHGKDFYRENGKKMCPKLVVVRLKYTSDWGNLPPAK